MKVLSKTMDSTSLSSDKLEFATLTLKKGKPFFYIFDGSEIDQLVKECDLKITEEEL